MAATTTARRACNLTTCGQNERLRRGVVSFTLTMIAAAVLLKYDVAPGWRLLLFFPFFIASNALFMGLYRSCGGMAFQGLRQTDDGVEKIANPELRVEAWRMGKRVILSGLCTAAVVTALVALIPTS
jgi:hypothetical protein